MPILHHCHFPPTCSTGNRCNIGQTKENSIWATRNACWIVLQVLGKKLVTFCKRYWKSDFDKRKIVTRNSVIFFFFSRTIPNMDGPSESLLRCHSLLPAFIRAPTTTSSCPFFWNHSVQTPMPGGMFVKPLYTSVWEDRCIITEITGILKPPEFKNARPARKRIINWVTNKNTPSSFFHLISAVSTHCWQTRLIHHSSTKTAFTHGRTPIFSQTVVLWITGFLLLEPSNVWHKVTFNLFLWSASNIPREGHTTIKRCLACEGVTKKDMSPHLVVPRVGIKCPLAISDTLLNFCSSVDPLWTHLRTEHKDTFEK